MRDLSPAAAPAGMTKSLLATPSLQSTWMTTADCHPAAGPAIVLVTTSEPGARNCAVAWTVVVNVADLARMSFWASVTPGVVAGVEIDVAGGNRRLCFAWSTAVEDPPVERNQIFWPDGTVVPSAIGTVPAASENMVPPVAVRVAVAAVGGDRERSDRAPGGAAPGRRGDGQAGRWRLDGGGPSAFTWFTIATTALCNGSEVLST